MRKIDLGQAISVLANVGVIAGIVFLGVQLQQNNKLLNAEAIGTVLEGRLDRQNLVLSGVDVASLMQRNAIQESLSPEDMTRINALRSHSLISWQRDYFLYQAGILPEQYFRANFPVMKRAIFGESGVISGSDHWETWSASAGAPDFAEFVEQCIRLDCEAIPR